MTDVSRASKAYDKAMDGVRSAPPTQREQAEREAAAVRDELVSAKLHEQLEKKQS